MSLSLLFQQCPACLVHLILIVFMMSGRTAAALWGAVSRTCSILLAAFLMMAECVFGNNGFFEESLLCAFMYKKKKKIKTLFAANSLRLVIIFTLIGDQVTAGLIPTLKLMFCLWG